MAGRDRRLRTRPVPYAVARLPREKVLARLDAGQLLREGRRDAADGSVYERRGLVEV